MSPRRLLATSASAAVLAGALVGLAPTTASAYYAPVTTWKGGVFEACRTTIDKRPSVKIRVDATESRRPNLTATVYRHRDAGASGTNATTRAFRSQAGRGEVSRPTVVPVRARDTMDAFLAWVERHGPEVELVRADLPHCRATS